MALITTDGYHFLKKEWDKYANFTPSKLTRIIWKIFPTITSVKWNMYKDVKREDCS